MSTSSFYDKPVPTQKKEWSGTGVTDANGNVTVAFPAGLFSAAPTVVISTGPTANANLIDTRITALSNASVSVNVQQSLAVTVLSISVLASKVAASGVTVQVHATETG